jgi:hypothetical protein
MSVEQPYLPERAIGLREGASCDDVVAGQEFLSRFGNLPSAEGRRMRNAQPSPSRGAPCLARNHSGRTRRRRKPTSRRVTVVATRRGGQSNAGR